MRSLKVEDPPLRSGPIDPELTCTAMKLFGEKRRRMELTCGGSDVHLHAGFRKPGGIDGIGFDNQVIDH